MRGLHWTAGYGAARFAVRHFLRLRVFSALKQSPRPPYCHRSVRSASGGYNLEAFTRMIYALVHYPNIDTEKINKFRNRYDPQAHLIQPHITLMFPVPESMGEYFLVHHIENVLRDWEPFPIHLQGIQKSWDDHLFLMVQEGSANIIDLHSKIYIGRLVDYLKEDLPFVPHLTLGVFNENVDKFPEALEEAQLLDLDYHCVLDKLNLVKVNDDRSRIVWSKEFASAK